MTTLDSFELVDPPAAPATDEEKEAVDSIWAERWCDDRRNGYICSRRSHVDGKHIAGSGTCVLARWSESAAVIGPRD